MIETSAASEGRSLANMTRRILERWAAQRDGAQSAGSLQLAEALKAPADVRKQISDLAKARADHDEARGAAERAQRKADSASRLFPNRFSNTERRDLSGRTVSPSETPHVCCCTSHSQRCANWDQYSLSFLSPARAARILHSSACL